MSKDVGMALLLVGVTILLLTLYLGYGLYLGLLQAINSRMNATYHQSQAPNTTEQISTSALVGLIVSSLMAQVPIVLYSGDVVAVLFLALFAGIGYKLTLIGIKIMSSDASAAPSAPQSGNDAGK